MRDYFVERTAIMMSRTIGGAMLTLSLAVIGCGMKQAAEPATPPPAAAPTVAADTVSQYDSGPRAGERAVDATLARQGEQLFQQKGCVACHGFGKVVRGPDLNGVTMRRTQTWMEHQILHPEVMTKEDPIARRLFAQYSLQMTNLGLTETQARAIIEFLKRKNRETGAAVKH